jgi:tetratricopeptide (TPR) repeat protein
MNELMSCRKSDPYRRGVQDEVHYFGERNEESNSTVELLNDMLINLPPDRRDLTIHFGRRILEIAPANTVAWWHVLNALAEEERSSELMCFARIASETFRSEPSYVYFLGWSYYLQNQFDIAYGIFEKVVAMDPWYDPALYWLGELAFERGSFVQSEEWFNRCHAIAPRKGGYLSRMALAVLFRGEPERARVLAEQARLVDPVCMGTQRNVAELLLYSGNLEEAEEALAPLPGDEVMDLLSRCWQEKLNRSKSLHLGCAYVPLYKRMVGINQEARFVNNPG